MHFSPSLYQVFELLKKHKGNIAQVDGYFVQFFITTKTDQETLTGNIYIYVIFLRKSFT